MLSPLYPGGQAVAAIYGLHFGTSAGTVNACFPGASPCSNTSSPVQVSQILYWGCPATNYCQINALLVAQSNAPVGKYDLQVVLSGVNGSGFAPGPGGGQVSGQSNRGQAPMSPFPTITLSQFGWQNNQDLWNASTFTSNGDTDLGVGTTVYSSGGVNNPVALLAGDQSPAPPYLNNIVLTTSPPITINGTLTVTVNPGDLVFVSTPISFVNGTANIPNVNLSPVASYFTPSVIKNPQYQFQWTFQPSGFVGPLQPFATTTHQIYFMHSYITNPTSPNCTPGGCLYRVTSFRLNFVTNITKNIQADDLYSLADALRGNLVNVYPKEGDAFHLSPAQETNVWSVMDGGIETGLDCSSLSSIEAAELQQLGYGTPTVREAFPTGANGFDDTDATKQESKTVGNTTYLLSFFNGNYFEGYIYFTPPDTPTPAAFTVIPGSTSVLGPTGCTVVPSSVSGSLPANQVSFRVLTSTYRLLGVTNQEWYWDKVSQLPSPLQLPDEIPLPRNSCPPSEN